MVIPEITAGNGTPYRFDITISAATSYELHSLSLVDNDLLLEGTLSVESDLTIGPGGEVNMSGGSLVTGGLTMASGIYLQGSGQITSLGTIDNVGNIIGNGMTLNVSALQNDSSLIAALGGLKVSAHLTNFSDGTLSQGTYESLDGVLDLNIGGAILTDSATIILDQGEIETSGTPITQTLQTIAPAGVLTIHNMVFAAANPLIDDGVVNLDGGTLSSPGLTIQQGGSFVGYGTIFGPVTDDGNLAVGGNATTTLEGPLDGTGTITILPGEQNFLSIVQNSSTLELAGVSTPPPLIAFADWNGVLVIDNPTQFTGTISGFTVGIDSVGLLFLTLVESSDEVILNGVSFSAITGVGYNGNATGGTLTLQQAGGTIALSLLGDYTVNSFVIANGPRALSSLPPSVEITLVTGQVPCFAKGTRIETEMGPVAVEDLHVGDRLVTAEAGEYEPIVWIGSRAVNCQAHPNPETVWPVRVRASAFGENVPARDLYLSPDHAVLVNDVLVPVKLLINGISIVQVVCAKVTYYHVELPRHDVILADGLSVESYLDLGDRANFHRDGEAIRLFPDFVARLAPNAASAWETHAAAPLVITGEILAAARAVVSLCAKWISPIYPLEHVAELGGGDGNHTIRNL